MNDIDDTVRKIDKWTIEIVINIAVSFATTLMVLKLYGVL